MSTLSSKDQATDDIPIYMMTGDSYKWVNVRWGACHGFEILPQTRWIQIFAMPRQQFCMPPLKINQRQLFIDERTRVWADMLRNDFIFACNNFEIFNSHFFMISQACKNSAGWAERVPTYLCSRICLCLLVLLVPWQQYPSISFHHSWRSQHSVATQREDFVPKSVKEVSVVGQVIAAHAIPHKTANWHVYTLFLCTVNQEWLVTYSVFFWEAEVMK